MIFSIIVPVYNVAPYLRECLDSVLAQTCADWECICVDDGSTDGSGMILDEYAKRDERFRVVHLRNAGVSAARNQGLESAAGAWVVFLDGDDVLAPRYLEIRKHWISNNPEVEIMCSALNEFQDGAAPEFPDVSPGFHLIDFGSPDSNPSPDSMLSFAGGFSVRRSIAASCRFSPYRYGEDRLYTFECFLRAHMALFSNAPLYGYRQRNSSVNAEPWNFDRLLQELSFRRDCIGIASESKRRIDWKHAHLMEWFLFGFFPKLAVCRFKGRERRELIESWLETTARLDSADGYSFFRRLSLKACHATRSTFLFVLMIYAMPRIARRLGFFHKEGGLS